MISDGKARRIAAEWHSPNTSMSAFSHLGMIDELLTNEIEWELDNLAKYDHRSPGYVAESRDDLQALLQYVQVSSHRGLVVGWSDLWDGAPVERDGTKCDLCGAESNSAPDLVCGFEPEDLETMEVLGPPCTGTYRANYR